MVMTALKPMGLSVEELARQTYEFAKGGIDIIKDDHGLANQRWAPFEQRVEACCEAVRRANEETGRRSIYAPTVCGPVEKIFQMAKFAKEKVPCRPLCFLGSPGSTHEGAGGGRLVWAADPVPPGPPGLHARRVPHPGKPPRVCL